MKQEEVKQMAHEAYKRHISNGGFGSKFDFVNGYIACANEHNQWHKVEDGLPPVDKYRGLGYFSIETLFTDGKYMFVGIYSFKSKMWIDRDYCFPTGRITHWMELPELPKEE